MTQEKVCHTIQLTCNTVHLAQYMLCQNTTAITAHQKCLKQSVCYIRCQGLLDLDISLALHILFFFLLRFLGLFVLAVDRQERWERDGG